MHRRSSYTIILFFVFFSSEFLLLLFGAMKCAVTFYFFEDTAPSSCFAGAAAIHSFVSAVVFGETDDCDAFIFVVCAPNRLNEK